MKRWRKKTLKFIATHEAKWRKALDWITSVGRFLLLLYRVLTTTK
ncbi:hypothetical protein [Sutcliffiella horikoshii]